MRARCCCCVLNPQELRGEMLAIGQACVGADRFPFSEVFERRNRKTLVIGCGLVVLQQVTGQPTVLYYATHIFKAAGFHGTEAAVQPLWIALVKLAFTLFAVARVEQYGRKPLLFWGICAMFVGLALLGAVFTARRCEDPALSLEACWKACAPPGNVPGCLDAVTLPHGAGVVALLSLFAYTGGYQVGFGPISWLVISEIATLRTRGTYACVCRRRSSKYGGPAQVCVGGFRGSLTIGAKACLRFFQARPTRSRRW